VNDHDPVVARAYARALFRSAVERDELAAVVEDIAALEAQWSGSLELRRFCKGHHAGNAKRHEQCVDDVWGATFTQSLRILLKTLAHREQLGLIPLVIVQFTERLDREQRRTHVEVEFAVDPTDAMVDQIRQLVRGARGAEMRMQVRTTPELIAGFRITLDDQRIDASMAGRLQRLRLGFRKPEMAG